ncbi:MAG TPA: hypothetical protein PK544_15125 [Spirochaetota bacterium]|nr:hypothetical protein [Spirochaetota bacterium]HPJ39367.1 hypothetical protein [Spirochaetota bacterium]HPQ52241.1 hypothetical protein [Spirochaetota bacterium]
MCYRCDGFLEKIRFREPQQYYNIVRQLLIVLEQETMVLLRGSCRLDDLDKEKPWPEDFIEHVFQCTTCGRKFMLLADTYNGCAGSWDVYEE